MEILTIVWTSWLVKASHDTFDISQNIGCFVHLGLHLPYLRCIGCFHPNPHQLMCEFQMIWCTVLYITHCNHKSFRIMCTIMHSRLLVKLSFGWSEKVWNFTLGGGTLFAYMGMWFFSLLWQSKSSACVTSLSDTLNYNFNSWYSSPTTTDGATW